jgi:ABC-type transport auxiliary lipoprotein component
MTMSPRSAVLASVLFAGCLSQSPPAPAVRWFDPSPPAVAAVDAVLVVTAAPFVRSEFVVRVGARELAIDELHRWVALPEQLLFRALGGGAPRSSRRLDVQVQRFELAADGRPRAVVELTVEAGNGPQPVAIESAAAGESPEAFAAAMATALERAAAAVVTIAAEAGRPGGAADAGKR